MFGVLFSTMILLTTATILQQQNVHASPITLGQRYKRIGVMDLTTDMLRQNTTSQTIMYIMTHVHQAEYFVNSTMLDTKQPGFNITGGTGTPYNQKLLTVNKTA